MGGYITPGGTELVNANGDYHTGGSQDVNLSSINLNNAGACSATRGICVLGQLLPDPLR